MIDESRNRYINELLRMEYQKATDDFILEWSQAFPGEIPPCRINEFGIIDEKTL